MPNSHLEASNGPRPFQSKGSSGRIAFSIGVGSVRRILTLDLHATILLVLRQHTQHTAQDLQRINYLRTTSFRLRATSHLWEPHLWSCKDHSPLGQADIFPDHISLIIQCFTTARQTSVSQYE
jgi:hypothetical protein